MSIQARTHRPRGGIRAARRGGESGWRGSRRALRGGEGGRDGAGAGRWRRLLPLGLPHTHGAVRAASHTHTPHTLRGEGPGLALPPPLRGGCARPINPAAPGLPAAVPPGGAASRRRGRSGRRLPLGSTERPDALRQDSASRHTSPPLLPRTPPLPWRDWYVPFCCSQARWSAAGGEGNYHFRAQKGWGGGRGLPLQELCPANRLSQPSLRARLFAWVLWTRAVQERAEGREALRSPRDTGLVWSRAFTCEAAAGKPIVPLPSGGGG